MKIITINVNKGGAGKTTFAHNFAEWLRKKERVLLLDFDDSVNLTHRYGYFSDIKATVVSLFSEGVVEPIQASRSAVMLPAGVTTVPPENSVRICFDLINARRHRNRPQIRIGEQRCRGHRSPAVFTVAARSNTPLGRT